MVVFEKRIMLLILAGFVAACGKAESDNDQSSVATNSSLPEVNDVSECAEVISPGRYTVPVTLSNTDSACDYYLTGFTTILSTLTIEPGTVIQAAQGAKLVLENGVLNAVGTPDQRIVIHGESPIQGFWNGIKMFNMRPSRLEYIDIEDGGNNGFGSPFTNAGLDIKLTTVSLVDISVSNSYVEGLNLDSSVLLSNFKRNQFFGNALAGLKVSMALIPQLDSQSDYLGIDQPNGFPVIHAQFDINKQFRNVLWPKLNAPYYFSLLSYGAGEKITLAPGTRVALNDNDKILLINGAVLEAHGTVAEPISFEPVENAAGHWDTIEVSGGVLDFKHVNITGATNGISAHSRSTVTLSDMNIADYTEYGISCTPGFSGDIIASESLRIEPSVVMDDSGVGQYSEECSR